MISLFEGHFLFKSPDSAQIDSPYIGLAVISPYIDLTVISPYIGLTVIWMVHSI